MPWIMLTFAILAEVAGTTCMKLSEGLTKLWPTAAMAIFYAASFSLMALALKKIDVSVAYAIWSALGTTFITIIGIAAFHESAGLPKIIFIAFIVIGVVGLNLSGGGH